MLIAMTDRTPVSVPTKETIMWTISFWKDTAERAIKTAAQALILGAGLAQGANLFEMDFMAALGLAAGGAVLSLLTSIVSAPFGEKGTASLDTTVTYTS